MIFIEQPEIKDYNWTPNCAYNTLTPDYARMWRGPHDGLVEIKEDAFITKDGDPVFEITEKGRLLYAAIAQEEENGKGALH